MNDLCAIAGERNPGNSSGPVSQRDSLEQRLDEGFRRIDEAKLVGTDVTEWEQFWIRLLREYEGVCRELDRAA